MSSYKYSGWSHVGVHVFLCLALSLVTFPVIDGLETACTLEDYTSLVQVERRTALTADNREKKHGADVDSNEKTVEAMGKSSHLVQLTEKDVEEVLARHEDPWIQMDRCSKNEAFVSLMAALVSVSIFAASSMVILWVFDFSGDDDMRKKFHATRIVPWVYLAIIGTCSIPLTLNRMWSENARFSEIVTYCVPIVPTFVVTQFALLLLYDLVWICGVFGTWRKKPLLLAHHGGYVIWCFLTLYARVGYMNLITIIIGFEELPELVASVSYLKKDGPHAHFWLTFTMAFRMCCSAYAIGCTILFITVGEAHLALKLFLWFDIGLWFAFMFQEWHALHELTLLARTKRAKTVQKDANTPEEAIETVESAGSS